MTSPRTDAARPAPRKRVAKKAPARKQSARKASVTQLPSTGAPDPLRPLGREGMAMWERVWAMRSRWISRSLDIDHITMLCESVDERVALRVQVLRGGEWRDRVALRTLDDQVTAMMGALGLNPTERAKLNVGEAPKGRLAELRAARAKQP